MNDLDALALTTVALEVADGVATVTLDRPEVHNAFNPAMTEELSALWRALRDEPDVRAIVLTGRGDKAFCTGIDRTSVPEFRFDPFTYEDPGRLLGPKSQELWKPVIAAVNGMACGGAIYLLGEADVIIAADHATFFDPHVTYGMVAAYEPILLLRRMPFGDVLRMAITGTHERVSAATALRLGLVSEVTTLADLLPAAQQLAAVVAAQPPVAVQSTLRTLWAAKDLPIGQATSLGNLFLQLGTSTEALEAGQAVFESGQRVEPKIR
ncbi:MAG TPA: enoyl-CoA hydratase/isomerase family protein [Acidimicrobiales bacterium]|nr:enoyl-CoA hydratase/isomerase family protein [Acidimicrobiales bacterium]